jgi:DNA adenine methylase
MRAPNNPDTYYEIFGGMAGVLIRKPRHRIETYNDIDRNLFCLIKHLAIPSLYEKFREIAKHDIHSYELFTFFKDNPDYEDNELYKAYRMYHLIKHSYGSQGNTWSRKIVKPGSVFEPEIVDRFHNRIKYVNIENMDFRKFIEKYDKKSAVAYLDPPYVVSTEKGHYDNNFDITDHRELSDMLRDSKMKWVLSYDNDELIRELYDGFEFHNIEIPYGTIDTRHTNNVREYRKELIITNFKVKKKKVLDAW